MALIKSRHRSVIMAKFSLPREVNTMLDRQSETHGRQQVPRASLRIGFLIEALRGKLPIVEERYGKGQPEFERYAIVASLRSAEWTC